MPDKVQYTRWMYQNIFKGIRKDTGWLAYRNEIIHASMNKNIEALYEDLEEQAEKGMELARFIDSQVRVLKTKGKVRKCL